MTKRMIDQMRWWHVSLSGGLLAVGTQALPVLAQLRPPTNIQDIGAFWVILCSVVVWLYTFAIVWSIVTVLLAAYKFLTSNGDEKAVTDGRNMLLYAAIGVVIALVAFGVPSIVASLINSDVGGAAC